MACVDAATVKASITTKSLITHSSILQNAMRGGFLRVLRWSEKNLGSRFLSIKTEVFNFW
jgi:hypothetical protein